MSVGARLAAGRDRVSRTDQTVVRGRFGQLSTKPMSRFRFAVPGGPWRLRGGNERGGSALFLEECWKDFPGPCILTLGGRYRGARLMSGGDPSGALRDIGTLFSSGMLGGLTDGQLLERFVNRDDSSAEDAFTILLERHGPMVWGVCRRLLSDRSAAADAFQATFLVLVRRARAVRVDDSLGPWLYGVSRRVAARARANSLRRRRARPVESRRWPAGPLIRSVTSGWRSWMKRSAASPSATAGGRTMRPGGSASRGGGAPARLPGRDGREPPVPRAAAAARPPGAARARSGRRGALGRVGPRSFGRDARGVHQEYGPVRDEFSRGRRRAGGGHRSCRRSDPDDVARKAKTAGRRRSSPDPRDRRGRRPGTPAACARGGAGTGQDRPSPDSRCGRRPRAGPGGQPGHCQAAARPDRRSLGHAA